jgi:hypothetical protein
LRVELVGTASNRPGIGSRVVATVGERRIVRDVFAPNGSVGQGPPELDLGTAGAERIGLLTVRWPSGREQVLRDVPSGTRIRVVEGEEGYRSGPLARGVSPREAD